jgi:predicted Fe-Mo cluster-binding NifX family protein
MKIAIPTDNKKGLEDKVAEHFGRCQTYTFLNEEGGVSEIIDNTSEDKGGRGLPPELIKEHGADVLLCKDIGPRAIILSKRLGLKTYVGPAITVREIFKMWKSGKIEEAKAEDFKAHKTIRG